jgi:acetyltransferase-like isoleucine patch superfamily enzyme
VSMERAASSAEPVAAPPTEVPPEIRGAPPPRRGGLLTLLRFMRRKRMLNLKYGRLLARLGLRKLRHGRRLVLDGLAFIGPGCAIQIGRDGRIELGRWSWIGHACKLRCHEGVISIGAKTVMGQECTISAYQHVSIGRECVIADRVMLIDFDHGMVDVEQPIRLQGIYKRDVRVGNNVWIGYGACVLRGVSVGDNAVIGTNAVVTRDVPANAVAAGVPARVIRMREQPRGLRWE